jgi:hypothetical protein
MAKKDEVSTVSNPLVTADIATTAGNPIKVNTALGVTTTNEFLQVSSAERAVLKVLLDRQKTSKLVHGGLKSLLTLTDDQERILLAFLERV